jgi:hypothetical protein
VHGIEHGAAVFLYDPCADAEEIKYFKKLAKRCLRRHIITPYKSLPKGQLYNVVTFGCRLELNKVFGKESEIINYLRVNRF